MKSRMGERRRASRKLAEEQHGAEGQSRGEGRGEGSRRARRPLPGETPASFSLMSKQDLVNSRTSAFPPGREASPAGRAGRGDGRSHPQHLL